MFSTMYGLPMLACLVVVNAAGADGPSKQQDAPSKPVVPKGLRVVRLGNSWHTENCGPICEAAGIIGHERVSGKSLHVWGEKLHACLECGDVDAVVIGLTDAPPTGPIALWPQIPMIVAAGSKNNDQFRVQVQMPWGSFDGRPAQLTAPEQLNDTELDELQTKMDHTRKIQEEWADKINAAAGRRVLFLVPVGDAILALRKMIKAGKFPGVVNHADVYAGDLMPHPGALSIQLGQYMHFAALYRMSPEGLDVKTDFTPVTPEQTAILKKLAWDTVSKYPYAGSAPPAGDPKGQAPTKP
jgi:hypothetical protein